jgi:hypothetical protein
MALVCKTFASEMNLLLCHNKDDHGHMSIENGLSEQEYDEIQVNLKDLIKCSFNIFHILNF